VLAAKVVVTDVTDMEDALVWKVNLSLVVATAPGPIVELDGSVPLPKVTIEAGVKDAVVEPVA
jgi:hypothetical protein